MTRKSWTIGLMVCGIALVSGCKEKDFAKSREKAGQAAEAARVATTQAIEDAKPYVEDLKKEASEVAGKVKTATTQAVDKIHDKIDDYRNSDDESPTTQPAEKQSNE